MEKMVNNLLNENWSQFEEIMFTHFKSSLKINYIL